MGKFSGMLICSDFDGTLARKEKIPTSNVEAIKYFRENGGKFTVVSGRTPEFFEKYSETVGFDGYIGGINGTVIYDVEKRETVEEYFIRNTERFTDFVLSNYKAWDNLKDVFVFGKERFAELSVSDVDFETKFREAMDQLVYKTLLHGKQSFEENEVDWVRRCLGAELDVCRSWGRGMEVNDVLFNKGVAAKRIAQLSGANTLICVGDYENDISLLKAADISFAAQNHHPSLDGVAKYIAAPCEVGTVADVIRRLEKL